MDPAYQGAPNRASDPLLPAVSAIRNMLGCGVYKARAHLRSGAVKSILAGNKILIAESELARFRASLPSYVLVSRKAA